MLINKDCKPREWQWAYLEYVSVCKASNPRNESIKAALELARRFKMCAEEIEHKDLQISALERKITELEYALSRSKSEQDEQPIVHRWQE